MQKIVMIIDGDNQFLNRTKIELSSEYRVETFSSGKEALNNFRALNPCAVIIDSGIRDVLFTDILSRIEELNLNVVRVVTSKTYSTQDIIDGNLSNNYFPKPVNFTELKKYIKSEFSYSTDGELQSVYNKVESILDKVKIAENTKTEAEVQLSKARDIEKESIKRVTDLTNEIKNSNEQITTLAAVVESLKKKALELEELKRRDIDSIERERDQTKEELKRLVEDFENLQKEKEKLKDDLNEIESVIGAEKNATISVSADLKLKDRRKEGEKNSLLFVDDETDLLDLVKETFEEDFEVFIADSGEKGLQTLRDNPEINVVVTDQRMPGLTGTEFAAKAHEEINENIPFYLLTGYTDFEVATQAINDRHISKYFQKPFDADDLKKKILEGFETYDSNIAHKEILTEMKSVVVEQIKEMSTKLLGAEHEKSKLSEKVIQLNSKTEKLSTDVKKLETENSNLRVSVAEEKKKMYLEMESERKLLAEELRKKKDEAERVIEVQRERNKEELNKLHDEFVEEKKLAEAERVELKKKLALEMEAESERAKGEMQKVKNEIEAEKEAIKAALEKQQQEKNKMIEDMEKTRKRFEVELIEKKAAVEKEIRAEVEKSKEELEKMKQKLAEEKEIAAKEQQKLKDELNEKLKQEKKKAAEEIQKTKERMEHERANIIGALEKELEEKRKKAEEENEKIRATITKELDQVKKDAAKKEKESGELITQSIRAIKERDDKIKLAESRVKEVESNFAKLVQEKEAALNEVQSMKSEYNMALQSREALEAEIAELKSS